MSRLTAYLVPLFLACTRLVGAQTPDSDFVERGPRFLLASAAAPVPVRVDVTRTPVLRQSISLDLNGVALGDALREISAKAGMQLAFSNTMLPPEKTVTFRADHITVAAALTEVLVDAQVDVLFSRDGRAVLVRRADFQGGTVSGKVTDAKTSRAIANVSVYLAGTHWRANTGEDGAYRMVDVAPGTYTLTASRIGYAKQSQSVTATAGQETTVDLTLSAAATELEQVVVTGTVVPTERKAIPTPISVISAQDIERENLQRVDQVFRGQVPGAFAWDLGAYDNQSLVGVRGASTLTGYPTIKTFIDGVEVANPSLVNTIDPTSVDRIEITRGPQASTLYGAGALNGVMQIFTKKGQLGLTRPEVTATLAGGSIGGFDGQGTALQTDNVLSVFGGGEEMSYNLGGSYRHTGEWLPSYGSTDWSVSAGTQTHQGPLTLSGSARYTDRSYDYPWDTRLQQYSPWSRPFYETDFVRQQTYGVTASTQATKNWEHSLTIGYDQSYYGTNQLQPRFRTPADSFLSYTSVNETKTSVFYHTSLNFRLSGAMAATATAGVDYDVYDYIASYTSGATTTTGNLDGSTSVTRAPWSNTGYFSQVQGNLGDRLFLTAGLRAERNPNFGAAFGTAWSPRVGASYVTAVGTTALKVRASYGESIRPPDPGERDGVQTPSYVILASPNLAPERQRGVDGGVEVYGRRASLGVTYYNQHAIDLIAYVTAQPPPGDTLPTSQYQNISRVKNEGWEFETRLDLGPVRLAGTYSITKSTVQKLAPDYPGPYQVGDRVLGIPYTSAGATVTYSPVPRTILTASLTYFGHWTALDYLSFYGFVFLHQPYRGSQRAYWLEYPSVTKLGFGLSQQVTEHFTAFVHAENLGNNLRFEQYNATPPKPRSATVGATLRY
jgi:outer membrane receptor protein involved in Fe transport